MSKFFVGRYDSGLGYEPGEHTTQAWRARIYGRRNKNRWRPHSQNYITVRLRRLLNRL